MPLSNSLTVNVRAPIEVFPSLFKAANPAALVNSICSLYSFNLVFNETYLRPTSFNDFSVGPNTARFAFPISSECLLHIFNACPIIRSGPMIGINLPITPRTVFNATPAPAPANLRSRKEFTSLNIPINANGPAILPTIAPVSPPTFLPTAPPAAPPPIQIAMLLIIPEPTAERIGCPVVGSIFGPPPLPNGFIIRDVPYLKFCPNPARYPGFAI